MRYNLNKFAVILSLLLAFLSLASCDEGMNIKPRSSGEPYDVVVVTPDARVGSMFSRMLEKPLAGLPQDESNFDVSHAADGTTLQSSRYARALVVVDIDESRHTATRLRYEKDVYATPQIIVYVETPSADSIAADQDRKSVV